MNFIEAIIPIKKSAGRQVFNSPTGAFFMGQIYRPSYSTRREPSLMTTSYNFGA